MKISNLRSQIIKYEIALVLVSVLVFAGTAEAGDYWILRDPSGRIALTNQKPKAGQTVVKHYELEDISAEEVREAKNREDGLRRERLAEERTRAIERLAGEIAKGTVPPPKRCGGQEGGQSPVVQMGTTTSVKVVPQVIVPKAK